MLASQIKAVVFDKSLSDADKVKQIQALYELPTKETSHLGRKYIDLQLDANKMKRITSMLAELRQVKRVELLWLRTTVGRLCPENALQLTPDGDRVVTPDSLIAVSTVSVPGWDTPVKLNYNFSQGVVKVTVIQLPEVYTETAVVQLKDGTNADVITNTIELTPLAMVRFHFE